MNSVAKHVEIFAGLRRPTKSRVSPDEVGPKGEYFARFAKYSG